MKTSYKWLRELTGLEWSVEEMAQRLTNCGTACEGITATDRYMKNVVVGQVRDLRPIEGADKLRLAGVELGSETKDLVCGAPNVAVGQYVPVALAGARLSGDIVIGPARIRGVESHGMICSERELGISDDHSGIMVLNGDIRLGMPLVDYLEYDDYQLTFELTPNRPDSLSAIGIARDAAALASVPVRKPQFSITESDKPASQYVAVSIEDPGACPRYAARVIENVTIGESPWWLKRKLLICGVRPINNVVDVTNYVLLECGHPLHAFDLDRFGSKEVVVRRARDKERFTTLDGREHELIPDVLLITNGKEGVAAAGVMGGMNSEVEEATTNILLESAYFNPSVIRQSRKHLGLVTESSSRFEKGADPNNGVEYAINRAACLMAELCGGEVLNGIVDCYPNRIEPKTVNMRPERCNAILGTDLSTDRMLEIFRNLEFAVEEKAPIRVTVPTFRPDIEREIDLIEEVVRIEGFVSVPDSISNVGPLYTPVDYRERFKHELRHLLTAAGFDEILSHGLADSRLAKRVYPELPLVKISNPVSADLDVMRNSLVSSVLTAISHNISHRNLDLRLFEMGRAYFPPDEKQTWVEEELLAMAVTGKSPNTWRDIPRLYDFYDVVGALNIVADHFRWGQFDIVPADVPFLEPGLSYELKLDGRQCGAVGQLAESLVDYLDIKQPLYIAEMSVQSFMQRETRRIEFEPLPLYPAAYRDLALVVANAVPAGELIDTVKSTAGELAESVKIFDLYTGKQIEKGKKSIAMAINFRSREGSLSSKEVDEIQENIVAALKKRFNAEIRDY